MKIAITAQGKDLDSQVDPRFGRAACILIVDTDSYEVKVIDNSQNLNAFKGAGIQAAATLSKSGAEVLEDLAAAGGAGAGDDGNPHLRL